VGPPSVNFLIISSFAVCVALALLWWTAERFKLLIYVIFRFDLIYTVPPPYNTIESITSENIAELGDSPEV
jgi:hypothetical protein